LRYASLSVGVAGSAGSFDDFPLTKLAQASGVDTPTRADLARLDRKRKKKGSNDDWTHPHDPDAKITKMKDGRTHLAHKAEHAVDLETGAIVGVTCRTPTTETRRPASRRGLKRPSKSKQSGPRATAFKKWSVTRAITATNRSSIWKGWV